jgi:transposase
MPLVAEVVDAVVGADTHRDTHALEMTAPSGATISTLEIDNDEEGFAKALAWLVEHAPGAQVVVGLEGTRSYGIGLARAIQAAGLVVVEVEHPKKSDRRRGKSDPIDARLAALYTLRLQADRLPTPRADGDREALRILLGARRELTTVRTRQINRLSTGYEPCCSPATSRIGHWHVAPSPMVDSLRSAGAAARSQRQSSRPSGVRRLDDSRSRSASQDTS